jgi:LuxR family transcriptional regulator, maltose regulon positive regulatory protein
MVDFSASLTELPSPLARNAAGDPQPRMPLLRSKLTAPALPDGFVLRPKLNTLLDRATGAALTVVVAPAGCGKTTLLSSWVRGLRRLSWMTAERDDDGDRFWSHVHASLCVTAFAEADGRPAVPNPLLLTRRSYLARVAENLAAGPEPVVLVVDDFHQLCDSTVPTDLDFLLRHAANRLRLVIASRTRPALALHRWRLSGELTEMDAEALAFTVPETAQLLASHGVDLPDAVVAAVRDRAAGWAAGLRLMAIEMRGHPDPAPLVEQAAADRPAIADYLSHEVLAFQPPDVQQVLLATSVAYRLHGGLVDALTGRADGERILADLESQNLFTAAIPGLPGWYQYHPLLGELLRAHVRRQLPARLTALHRRAAHWHAAQGLGRRALWHALAARDWTYATTVLFEQWPHIVTCPGSDSLVLPAPGEAEAAPPELALAWAADRLAHADTVAGDRYLSLAEAGRQETAPADRSRFDLVATALHVVRARLCAGPDAVVEAARRLLAWGSGPGDGTGEPDRRPSARAVALTALGSAQLGRGDFGAAAASLAGGLDAAEHAGLACARLFCSARLAWVWAARGELRRAHDAARAALQAPPCPAGCGADSRAYAYLALAVAHCEWDRLDEAARYLDLAEGSGRTGADPLVQVEIATARSGLCRASDDLSGAYDVLRAARLDLNGSATRYATGRLALAEAEVRVGWGDTATVRTLVAPMLGDANPPPTEVAVPLARAHLRDGDPGAAARLLPRWTDDRVPDPLPLRLEVGLLCAVAAHCAGDAHGAARCLERVLALAEPQGFRRLFTHGGPTVRAMLARQLDAGTAYWWWVRDILGDTDPSATGDSGHSLVEPLSDRELTVLRYLQGSLSNLEIAADLSVSVNTVKSHVRNIYRKLAVARRREAVRRARDFNLL